MKRTEFPATVILADGCFPEHEIPLGCLRNASRIICCDGAAASLIEFGLEPFAIVGDCDSLDPWIIDKYAEKIFEDADQETNDLTKAVRWCYESGYKDIVILGATGKREDHTIGNISLLAEYARTIRIIMVTDTGTFYPFLESCRVPSLPGQQVSVFSIDPETEITSSGLKYPLVKRKLRNWWEATLNEAESDYINLEFKDGAVIIYMVF
ncbi:MAG: thiamine diphosphokinase [Bacteroidia bacterium]|nr:thiamine diphosphokinase [Bacteroidia bacterium]